MNGQVKNYLMVDLGAPKLKPVQGQRCRWLATVTYRSDDGPVVVTHEIEELYELHMIIERGFDFNCIADIKISMTPERRPDYRTLEEAWAQ